LLLVLLWSGGAEARTKHRVRHFRAKATAYSQAGITASGTHTQRGVVAADPQVLPLGTLIRIKGPGVSGTYLVTDTGRRIDGREIDIFMPSRARAKRNMRASYKKEKNNRI
jgi:3D (Asp-Asp-Asp) domain-containing protein